MRSTWLAPCALALIFALVGCDDTKKTETDTAAPPPPAVTPAPVEPSAPKGAMESSKGAMEGPGGAMSGPAVTPTPTPATETPAPTPAPEEPKKEEMPK